VTYHCQYIVGDSTYDAEGLSHSGVDGTVGKFRMDAKTGGARIASLLQPYKKQRLAVRAVPTRIEC
jgi:hypothetical protein